ncbi:putative secreted protein [Sorangium cellulosum So ce56]|uniref:Secreted protein n=1 Tax=Sorangium cellulosum (strain So ce56) TaxID=448385 RepID=A9G7C0_SORC5|nr:hypothetical protein [Sorangium cellulosum]CAN95835.1 putative secreted protein [Sorangium cellulosum So ce56]
MKANTGVAIAAGAAAVLCGSVAAAQDFEGDVPPSYLRSPLGAPANALELGLNLGYAQGFGDIGSERRLRDVAGPGAGVGVKLVYRAVPKVGLGLTSRYEQYMAQGAEQGGADVRGVTLGAEASFHLAPFERVDPVISLGSGYRALWTAARPGVWTATPAGMWIAAPAGVRGDTVTHGIELGRLQAVIDVRMSESVALGPTIGGGLNLFLWENTAGSIRGWEVQGSRVNSFVFAGLEGRFDLGGQRVREVIQVARRR